MDRLFYATSIGLFDRIAVLSWTIVIFYLCCSRAGCDWPAAFIAVSTATTAENSGGLSAHELIFGNAEHPRRRAILLAASGGGTRAAIYSAAILQGLHQIGAINDLVIGSGVSGGSAGLAYFAMHQEDLRSTGGKHSWQRFADTMSHPYIADVILHAFEWRVYADQRVGELLAEAFADAFPDDSETAVPTVGDIHTLGLIFNTTLTGEAFVEGHCDGKVASGSGSQLWSSPLAENAGRIVMITNLNLPGRTSGLSCSETSNSIFGRVIDGTGISIAKAAAASANFPPVFPDVMIDLGGSTQVFVTDGGAVENRGIISLLEVLENALREESERRGRQEASAEPLPEIHVIVADASLLERDYESQYGVGAVLAGSDMLGQELMAARWREIQAEYENLGGSKSKVTLHRLQMPLVFRSRGGIGTHGMMPKWVTFRDPRATRSDRAVDIQLTGDIVRRMVMGLTSSGSEVPYSANPQEADRVLVLQNWIDHDPFKPQWADLARALGSRGD
jgi:hypothetical protein